MLHYIKNSRFVKNIGLLAGATLIVQVISFFLTPIITRLYSPENYGLYGTLITCSSILVSFFSLKFEMGIIKSDNIEEERDLTFLSLASVLVFFLFTFLIGLSFEFWDFSIFGIEGKILIGSSIIAFFLSISNIFQQVLNNLEKYKVISLKTVLSKLVITSTQILYGLKGNSYISLILGQISGLLIGMIYLLSRIPRTLLRFDLSIKRLKKTVINNKYFPRYLALQGLLNAVSQSVPVIFLNHFYSETIVGNYFLAIAILQLPLSLLGKSIRQVFFKNISVDNKDPQKILKKLKKIVLVLSLLSTPFLFIIIFFGIDLFTFIFGDDWIIAGEFSKYLIFWVVLMFINIPTSSVLILINKQKVQAQYEFFLLFVRVISFLICGYYFDYATAIILFSFVGFVFNLYLIVKVFKLLSDEVKFCR